jgi:hypothetical protein
MMTDALKDSVAVASIWVICILVAAAIITRAIKE